MGPRASRADFSPILRRSFLRRVDDELRGGPPAWAVDTPSDDDWEVDNWSGGAFGCIPLSSLWHACECHEVVEDAVEARDLPRARSAGSRGPPEKSFSSSPPPPEELWDEAHPDYLEKVRCRARIRLIGINAKLGTFHLRMKCHWSFRALSLGEHAEADFRGIPGIRMPGVSVVVEESRIWKDLPKKEKKDLTQTGLVNGTILWRGTSTFAITGHKAFRMDDFPFDRHILNLEKLEKHQRSRA
jgi:hypothetical protein